MPRNRLRFRPPLAATVATAALLPLLIALGFWQLGRAEQKARLQADYDARLSLPAVALGSGTTEVSELRYRRVTARGTWDADRLILLDNRVHHGRVGYHVLTPLRLEGGDSRVLVNRGWIALGDSRDRLPHIDTPAGTQTVDGLATVPSAGFFTLESRAPSGSWETVWQNLDLRRFAASVSYPVLPVVVLLDPSSPGGFEREWARLDAGIATHRGYAVQWFALAAVLLVYYLGANLRRNDDNG